LRAGSVRRVTGPGSNGRARWYLGGLAVLLVAGVLLGILVERDGPAAGRSTPGSSWSPATPSAGTGPTPGQSTAVPPRYVFPVAGAAEYEKTHHDYPATDIIAPCGFPVLAVTDGVVLEVSRKDTYDAGTDDGTA